MTAQILVVKPKTLTVADKKLLRAAGVVCVESTDPSSVRLVSAEAAPLGSNQLFLAAMTAIAADKYISNTAEVFAKQVAVMCKASAAIDAAASGAGEER